MEKLKSSVMNELDHPEKSDMAMPGNRADVSVIVPVVERCDDLSETYRSHAGVLRAGGYRFEFVFVFDEAFSDLAAQLDQLLSLGEPVKTVILPRSYGEATALMIGVEEAQGELVVTVPAYFQTVPEGVLEVLQRLEAGNDVVVVRRWPRIDPWINRMQNRVFHFVIRSLTGVALHDLGCGLKGIKRKVFREVNVYGDLHRFLPVLAYQRGFRLAEIEVAQHERDAKLRVYRPGLYLRRLLDILTLVFLFKFTKKPLRFFGLIGSGLFGTGFLISLGLAIERMLGLTALTDRPLLVLGVLLMVLGAQTASIGLLGEIIIFTHARKMKDYAVEKFLK